MLAILDYKAGNQTSVRRALDHLGIPNQITADPDVLEKADGIIFPGVGAAGQAMGELTSGGLDEVLKGLIWREKPLLGICVGCQILLDYCEENDTKTLAIIPGECRLFNPAWTEEDGTPHPRAAYGLEQRGAEAGLRAVQGYSCRCGVLLRTQLPPRAQAGFHHWRDSVRRTLLLHARTHRSVGCAVPPGKKRHARLAAA